MSELAEELEAVRKVAQKHAPIRIGLWLEVDASGRERLFVQGLPGMRPSKILGTEREERNAE